MPLGFGKKDEIPFKTDITDKDELGEIRKIADRLEPDEKVLVVAKQSRVRPGGSAMTPAIIFATDRRLIIKDPSALGLRQSVEDIPYVNITSARLQKGVFSSSILLRAQGFSTMSERNLNSIEFGKHSNEGEIDAIPKDKAQEIVNIISQGITNSKSAQVAAASPPLSIADELAKLAKLKESGVLTDTEFIQMKQDLIRKSR
ncbi:MAG: PH domain-containing protein [Nitrososphaera sp.]|jgi:hypothetical protein